LQRRPAGSQAGASADDAARAGPRVRPPLGGDADRGDPVGPAASPARRAAAGAGRSWLDGAGGGSVTALGFVGLGTMGGRMARRLLAAGYPVAGYNRTVERAAWLEGQGLVRCASPREVAERSDVVLSMVTNTAALEAVTLGEDGLHA